MEMSNISMAVATAVEQQNAAVDEIARNASVASDGTRASADHMAIVRASASSADETSKQVNDQAGYLAQQAQDLRREVDNFLQAVRAA